MDIVKIIRENKLIYLTIDKLSQQLATIMNVNKAEELRMLASLRDSGIISQAEFQQRKDKIMKSF